MFDKSKTGKLNREEVRALCESIMNEVTPLLGGVTEDDIDQVMRIGGNMATPEITIEEIPTALSTVLALKSNNFRIHDLFKKHDTDNSGMLHTDQLKTLIAEINEGEMPTQEDIDYILKQCDTSGEGHITESQVKAAISAW